ncbi:MAG: M14 family metallopeptidase [Rhodospirillaceae bacterium]|nr:M14 family metallopeptidase [Rhodospirillaceae bacterium]
MSLDNYFAEDYAGARARFRDAAATAGLAVASHEHPYTGPAGESLALDVVTLCPDASSPCRADKVFVVMSGTHGVEGFAGSAAQVAWLSRGEHTRVPEGISVLILHAVNPHGFAWVRRVTEDNVDLNRNFADFSRARPRKPAYEELAAAICPPRWTPEDVAAADAVLAAYAERHGRAALNRAIMGGQYSHPDGVFFGGVRPSWSRETILKILGLYCAAARHVAILDIHTGLGPFGHGESYCVGDEGAPSVTQAHAVWGDDVRVMAAAPGSGVHDGYNLTGLAKLLAPAAVYGNTLEFGTYPVDDMLRAIRADNWLHQHGEILSDQGRAIKAELKRMFYPADAAWQAQVLARCLAVWRRGLDGLAALA